MCVQVEWFLTNAVKYFGRVTDRLVPLIRKKVTRISAQRHTIVWTVTNLISLSLIPIFIIPGSAVIPLPTVSMTMETASTQPSTSIVVVVGVGLYQIENKVVLIFVVDAPKRASQRGAFVPANLNVIITRATVVHVQVAMIVKLCPTIFTNWK